MQPAVAYVRFHYTFQFQKQDSSFIFSSMKIVLIVSHSYQSASRKKKAEAMHFTFIIPKAIPIKCFVSHRLVSCDGGSVGREKKKKKKRWKKASGYECEKVAISFVISVILSLIKIIGKDIT